MLFRSPARQLKIQTQSNKTTSPKLKRNSKDLQESFLRTTSTKLIYFSWHKTLKQTSHVLQADRSVTLYMALVSFARLALSSELVGEVEGIIELSARRANSNGSIPLHSLRMKSTSATSGVIILSGNNRL